MDAPMNPDDAIRISQRPKKIGKKMTHVPKKIVKPSKYWRGGKGSK